MNNKLRRSGYLPNGGGSAPSVEPLPTGILASVVSTGFNSAKSEYSNALEGRLSLAAINGIVLAMIVFYIWTHGIQGGG